MRSPSLAAQAPSRPLGPYSSDCTPAALGADIMHPAELPPAGRADYLVVQVRQADHSAPRLGISARALFSATCEAELNGTVS